MCGAVGTVSATTCRAFSADNECPRLSIVCFQMFFWNSEFQKEVNASCMDLRMRGINISGVRVWGWSMTQGLVLLRVSPVPHHYCQSTRSGKGNQQRQRGCDGGTRQRLTLLYPGLQGSCCHGHCEWKSVALQSLHTEQSNTSYGLFFTLWQ